MVEIQCEIKKVCNTDQTSFKAYTLRWLAVTTQLCPWTKDKIMPKIRASGMGAAAQCLGGDDRTWCGQNWNSPIWDGTRGAGEQMSALAAISANLITGMPKPVTGQTGGLSQSDPNAGNIAPRIAPLSKLTAADTVGASILTVMAGLGMVATCRWLMLD
jgi:mannan endo-1,6-alpha-mannosidase